ncbi:MAG: chemotaxis protein CheW [Pseudomonadota bacterium]
MTISDPILDTAPDQPNVSAAGRTELLTFQCGGRAYAVDIMNVREIRSWSPPTPLPHSPAYMLGMVNLRGSVLPVMDLAQRLGAQATEDHPRNVIIVVTVNDRVHGLLVDAVSDIVHPDLNQLQDVPPSGATGHVDMADKLFVEGEAMIQILSIDRVLPARILADEAVLP